MNDMVMQHRVTSRGMTSADSPIVEGRTDAHQVAWCRIPKQCLTACVLISAATDAQRLYAEPVIPRTPSAATG
jgi:hypothetical protein